MDYHEQAEYIRESCTGDPAYLPVDAENFSGCSEVGPRDTHDQSERHEQVGANELERQLRNIHHGA